MLIDRVSRQLTADQELVPLVRELDAGHDASVSVAQSARPLVLAALWARNPRPCLLVVSGEVVSHAAFGGVHLPAAESLFVDFFSGRGLHEWRTR